jgi:poly(3-hydroxybutyrate) depolymerase
MIRPCVLAAAVAASAAAAQDRPMDLARLCPSEQPQNVAGRGGPGLLRLDRLPPAEAYLAVLRRENGCTRPQLVREFQSQTLRRR